MSYELNNLWTKQYEFWRGREPLSEKVATSSGGRVVWIDLWRFIACLAIMNFHFPLLGGVRFHSGGLFVEFFFLLSGYFAIAYMKKAPDKRGGIQGYMKRMYLKILPFVVVGVALVYFKVVVTLLPDGAAIAKRLSLFPFEILLLQCTGLYKSIYYVLWYLSILMICLPIVMYAYKKLSDKWL